MPYPELTTASLALCAFLAAAVVYFALTRHRASRLLAERTEELRRALQDLAEQKIRLDVEMVKRSQETEAIKDATILALAGLAETRDTDTGAHIRRTQMYIRILAEAAQKHPQFAPELNGETINLLYKTAPLHDIGKVGIPDKILFKPGPLTAEEFAIMKEHTTLGGRAIAQAQEQLGVSNSFLDYAHKIATTHHERWDGSGYPAGLRGEQIPLAGRLMAIADVYDALRSRRVYKPPYSHEEACEIIRRDAGKQFDPTLAGVFVEVNEAFRRVAEKYMDE